MAETKENTTRDAYVRRNFISECRDNRIVVDAHLSPNIRRIYRRHFDGLSRAVYLIRFYCRIARGPAIESTLTKEIIDLMDEVNDNLDKKINVAERLISQRNIKITNPQFEKMNVTIIDPLAYRFLETIKIAQKLDEKVSALWLSNVLDDEQRSRAMNEAEGELRSIQGKARALSLGLRDRMRSQSLPEERPPEIEIAEKGMEDDDQGGDNEEAGQAAAGKEKSTESRKPIKSKNKDKIAGGQDEGDEIDTEITDESLV